MKILISDDGGTAHSYLRIAAAKAFLTFGHDCKVWQIGKKPVSDVFDEFNPDVFISQTYNLTDQICTLIKERPHLRVALRAPDFSPLANEVSRHFPILTAKPEEVKRVLQLKEETGQPEFIHCHYPQESLNETHASWIKSGVKVVSVLNFADPFSYYNGILKDEFRSDITFIGSKHPYKSRTLDPYIGQLFDPDYEYNIRVFGGGWSGPYNHGFAPEEIIRDLLASATVCPNVSEPHSQELGWDIIQRPFNLLLNKCFCVSDYVEKLAELIPEGIVYAKTPKDFKGEIDYYLRYPECRTRFIENGFREVRNKHTSFDRAFLIMKELGLPQLGLEQFKQKVGL